MDWLDVVSKLILPTLTLLLGILGGWITLRTFLRNARTRRAEWLYSLFAKFYEDEKGLYREIRSLLDYKPEDRLRALYEGLGQECPKDEAIRDLCEKLVNYLNFFEFIAGLWRMGQISLEEIDRLFDYYLRLLDAHPPILGFLTSEGFENLDEMLRARKERPQTWLQRLKRRFSSFMGRSGAGKRTT